MAAAVVSRPAVQRSSSRVPVVLAWCATRAIVLLAAVAGAWSSVSQTGLQGYANAWRQWDTYWFLSIVEQGYASPDAGAFVYNVAFFPGLPVIMGGARSVGLDPVLAGVAVSLAASLIAALGLARLVEEAGGSGAIGVWAWLAAPTALFLAAAYTEALFAAFAIWSWVLARRGRWVTAGLLAGGAAAVRPNGIFLAVGLAVLFATRPATRRRWIDAWPLAVPVVVTLSYFAYLRSITGSWTAWTDAQREHWGRELVAPWTALANTYEQVFTFLPTGEPSSRMVTELIAMGILVIGAALLLAKRWWGEAAYALATAASLGTSTIYHSVPRTLAIVFPLWVLLGAWLSRHRGWFLAYLIACLPALVLVTMRFVQAQWIS